jgi:putative hydrolase of the HAD superfamily
LPPNFQTIPKELNNKEIDNIIFDLGGVIINLNIEATFRKFSELFQREIGMEAFLDHEKYHFFRAYEVGKIDDYTFREHIRALGNQEIKDADIDDAWNAMLQNIPAERMAWIHEMTKKYNCVVLSNTNSIHIRHFNQIFNSTTTHGYPEDIFLKVFYSHEIGERKPDAAAFEVVLKETGFIPDKTVVFDDLKDNLETAKRLGMHTVYVERNLLRRDQLFNGRF